MPRHIPVDLILHALVESLLELPEDHLRDLARAISAHCIDPRIVADQWCDGAGVAQSAAWLVRRLMGASHHTPIPAQHVGAETRAMEVAIARRLADVGLALLVTQDAEDRSAASLLLDASRLVVGLERTQAAGHDDEAARTIDALRYEVKAKAANIDNLMDANFRYQRDIAEKDAAIERLEDAAAGHPFLAKIRTALDLNADAPEAEIITAAYGVLRAARNGGFQYVERMRDSGLLAEANKHEAAAAAALAKIGIAIRLGSDATIDAIIARAEALTGAVDGRAVMARRPPHERLTWVARFNNGNGGASITIDGHTVFVSGTMARELSEALYRHQHVLKARTEECDALREKLTIAQANSATFIRERDKAYGVLCALGWDLGDDGEWTAPATANRPTFKPGDRVVVARKAESRTCEWTTSNGNALGRTGEVRHIDEDGDVQVAIDDDRLWFIPACLDLAPSDTRTMRERLEDRGLDPATVGAAPETNLPQFIAPAEETERPQFKVGDRVRFKPHTKTGEHPSHGEEGCIDRVDTDDSRLPFRVKWFALSDFTTWHRAEHMTLITPTA